MAKKIGFGVALWLIGFVLYSGILVLPLAAVFQWIIFIILSAVVAYFLAMAFFQKHDAVFLEMEITNPLFAKNPMGSFGPKAPPHSIKPNLLKTSLVCG